VVFSVVLFLIAWQAFLLDQDGKLLLKRSTSQSMFSLPQLFGLSRLNFAN
jgi:hypothetical protein